jgi:uncharacterized membrane protein YjdF
MRVQDHSIQQAPPEPVDRAQRWVSNILHLVMIAGIVLALLERHWLDAVIITGIILVMWLPAALGHHLRVRIPAEFELAALVFLFASLFLGEVRDYYTRFWWWDLALHTVSGLLLGILGFLLVYVLNEDENVDFHILPRFVSLFAFMFAVACGALWEIFEFSMDRIFGMNMQKPMFGDPSGLTDTMWDLIVDTLGAALISLFGWTYLKQGRQSFVHLWIEKFVQQNPHLFNRRT